MNKRISCWTIVAMIAVSVFSTSCRRQKDTLDPKVEQFNNDANYYKGESDQADNDINSALGDISAFKTEATYSSPLCGVTIDTSDITNKIVYFNFDGVTPCFSPSRTRSGQIKVQLTTGLHWGDVGAVLTITYINFKVTRLVDNKSIEFNGVKTLKNLDGHNWLGFLLGSSDFRYQERAFNVNVTFDDGSVAIWNSARITQWHYIPSETKITFTAQGDTSVNGFSSVDSWGTNRYGDAFTTYYTENLISDTYCGLWRPNAGELVHNIPQGDFTLTLGVDQSGNPTPYACAYGYKVSWQGASGNNASVVLSY